MRIKVFCISESINTIPVGFKITFVNSQHKNNLKGYFVLNPVFKR